MFRLREGHTFLGKVYEHAVKRAIHYTSRIILNMYNLSNQKSAPRRISLSVSITKVHENDLNEKFKNELTEHLFWPLSKTQASFDFVQPPYIFQITLSTCHSVKSDELLQLMQCFPSIKQWYLVFIIPFRIAAEFKEQSIFSNPKLLLSGNTRL